MDLWLFLAFVAVFAVGAFLGLVAGAFMAREDLRAASASLGDLDRSGASAPEVVSPAPTHTEGR